MFKNPDALNEDIAVAMQPPLAAVDVRASLDDVFADLSGSSAAVVVGIAGRPAAILTRSDLLEFLAHRRTHIDLGVALLRPHGRQRAAVGDWPSAAALPALAPHGREDGADHDHGADRRRRVERLPEQQRPEGDRDERVDVLVRHDLRDRGVAEGATRRR